jgi:hypothetical protein
MTMIETTSVGDHSHLFTVRVWIEELSDGQMEWRGQVRYVLTGEIRYFRNWATLIALITTMLPTSECNEE